MTATTKLKTPWNKGNRKYERECICCNKLIKTSIKNKRFCNHSCANKHHNFLGIKGFKKGRISEKPFLKGHKPWNYIDGRSKNLGKDRYGDDWSKVRMLIYARDKFTCQECGITMTETREAHHVHHKVPFLISFDNSLNNLITLCPSCHRKEDAKLIKELKITGQIQ